VLTVIDVKVKSGSTRLISSPVESASFNANVKDITVVAAVTGLAIDIILCSIDGVGYVMPVENTIVVAGMSAAAASVTATVREFRSVL